MLKLWKLARIIAVVVTAAALLTPPNLAVCSLLWWNGWLPNGEERHVFRIVCVLDVGNDLFYQVGRRFTLRRLTILTDSIETVGRVSCPNQLMRTLPCLKISWQVHWSRSSRHTEGDHNYALICGWWSLLKVHVVQWETVNLSISYENSSPMCIPRASCKYFLQFLPYVTRLCWWHMVRWLMQSEKKVARISFADLLQ